MTNQDTVMDLLRSIMQDVSEEALPTLSTQTRITDLGIDSVSLVEIVCRIEETLNIEIPSLAWLDVRTIQDLLNMIERAKAESRR